MTFTYAISLGFCSYPPSSSSIPFHPSLFSFLPQNPHYTFTSTVFYYPTSIETYIPQWSSSVFLAFTCTQS